MRFIPTFCLEKDMVVGQSIKDKSNNQLFTEGDKLNNNDLKRITKLNLNGIYIKDELKDEEQIKEIIENKLKKKTITKLKNVEQTQKRKLLIKKEILENILKKIIQNKNLVVNMSDLKRFDDYTFNHSLNVASLSIVMGIALSFNSQQIYELGLSALLHDMGKVFISKSILNKNSKLTKQEFEIMKTHAYRGYKYLKKYYELPRQSYLGALQHHECLDGTGYPYGIRKNEISLFGKIIAIADVYDALISDRPYRNAKTSSDAIDYILVNSESKFDLDLVKAFSNNIVIYPLTTCVKKTIFLSKFNYLC
ncbi:MAG: HD-GYP domain-containing protein [Candidatus Woesearchaeota archaeon]